MLESGIDFMHECEETDEPVVYTEYVYEDDYPFPMVDEYYYIPFDAEDDYTKIPKRKYVYKNDVIVYSNREQRYLTVRLSLDNIVVTKGKITFLVEGGSSFYIEDDGIIHNISNDIEKSLSNKYE